MINIIGIAILSLMFARTFEPIQKAKSWIVERFRFLPFVYDALNTLLFCPKCFGFWFYLIVFQDLIGAALCSFIAYLLNHTVDRIEEYYE
jgi:hypothetical protein